MCLTRFVSPLRQKVRIIFALTSFILMFALTNFMVLAQDTSLEVTFPLLTGPYAVGKVERHLVDEARDEIFTEHAEDKRELMVAVYYPAEPAADSVPAPYVESGLAEALGLTSEVIAHIQTSVYA